MDTVNWSNLPHKLFHNCQRITAWITYQHNEETFLLMYLGSG